MSIGSAAPAASFQEHLRQRVLLLDGAMGTELDRRGVSTALPLWSARALIERPEVVRQIHLDYLLAGADIVTTNTFRTTRRTMRTAGVAEDRAAPLTALAVQLAQEARDAAGRPESLIAGSLAPLEDCYSPWLTPPAAIATAEHREQAAWLATAGVDLLMVETMPTSAEAEAALTAALATGLPVTVGFVCEVEPRSPTERAVRLLSGEPLTEAVDRLQPYAPAAFLVNCAAPAVITRGLKALAAATDRPIGGYANLGTVDPVSGWHSDDSVTADDYAVPAQAWIDAGARIIGGCCGTTIRHTAGLRRLLDRESG